MGTIKKLHKILRFLGVTEDLQADAETLVGQIAAILPSQALRSLGADDETLENAVLAALVAVPAVQYGSEIASVDRELSQQLVFGTIIRNYRIDPTVFSDAFIRKMATSQTDVAFLAECVRRFLVNPEPGTYAFVLYGLKENGAVDPNGVVTVAA